MCAFGDAEIESGIKFGISMILYQFSKKVEIDITDFAHFLNAGRDHRG